MTNPQPDTHEVPNVETVAAMLEAEKIATEPGTKYYHSVKDLFADLEDGMTE